jgi:Hypoxia induced protein conserved region
LFQRVLLLVSFQRPSTTDLRANYGEAIILADKFSSNYEVHRNKARLALQQHKSEFAKYEAQKPVLQQAKDWASEHRYSIVFASWVASMGVSLALVRRNPYLTTSQKLVQARVYAQGLTVATLLASFAFEARDATLKKGRWETVKVLDPNDPLHQRLIEKRIHHERYEGEDQWMGKLANCSQKALESNAAFRRDSRRGAADEGKTGSTRG